MMAKVCHKCKKRKSSKEFWKDKRCTGKRISQCRDCIRIKRRVYYRKSRARQVEYGKNYRITHAKQLANYKRRYMLKTKFGITVTQYNDLLKAQQGKCAICKRRPNQNTKRLAVDHNHKTSQVRGLLCYTCNRFIGWCRDDVRTFKRIVKYLQRSKR